MSNLYMGLLIGLQKIRTWRSSNYKAHSIPLQSRPGTVKIQQTVYQDFGYLLTCYVRGLAHSKYKSPSSIQNTKHKKLRSLKTVSGFGQRVCWKTRGVKQ